LLANKGYSLTMPKTNLLKTPAPKDRYKAVIKAALEKKGWALRGMSTFNSLSHGAERAALDSNSSIAEEVIADAFGVTPKEIWLSHFEKNNTPNKRSCNVKQRMRDMFFISILISK